MRTDDVFRMPEEIIDPQPTMDESIGNATINIPLTPAVLNDISLATTGPQYAKLVVLQSSASTPDGSANIEEEWSSVRHMPNAEEGGPFVFLPKEQYNADRKVLQYNDDSERHEILCGDVFYIHLGIAASMNNVVFINLQHSMADLSNTPIVNCGRRDHHNDACEEAAFSIPLPGVTYRCIRSHHYARVPLEEETRKIPMKIHCWGSEEKNHGRQQKNRKWLLRVQGSLGIITFNEAIYIQAMKMLRPVSSIENGVPVSRIKKSLKRKAVPETKEANIKKEHQDEIHVPADPAGPDVEQFLLLLQQCGPVQQKLLIRVATKVLNTTDEVAQAKLNDIERGEPVAFK